MTSNSDSLPIPIARALAIAAQETGKSRAELHVIDANPVDWPDTSLGVPEPGMMYAQMVTPGYLVRIRAGDDLLTYHTDLHERVVRVS